MERDFQVGQVKQVRLYGAETDVLLSEPLRAGRRRQALGEPPMRSGRRNECSSFPNAKEGTYIIRM
jgi:hypothetical protein